MKQNGNIKMTDAISKFEIKQPKDIARITICNAVTFTISEICSFTPPTEEQRKNLKELFCIDVEILGE